MTLDCLIKSVPVEMVTSVTSVYQLIADKMNFQKKENIDDPFYVVIVNEIARKYEQWQRLMPRVTPYYAVSCLSEPGVIELLARLGLSFVCLSKNEIVRVMEAGVGADRIFYSSTFKQPDMLRFAASKGVDLMTFDNEEELHKIKRHYPVARLVMRLLPPSSKRTSTNMGHKYGCPLEEVRTVLRVAKTLDLTVIGMSFHVGVSCIDASSFADAVQTAAQAFVVAKSEGLKLELLDIGGGFHEQPALGITMEQIVDELVPALNEHFPEGTDVRLIAEPGSFFVDTALHLVTQVIGRRVTTLPAAPEGFVSPNVFEYYLNDGAYGSQCPGLGIRRPLVPVKLSANLSDRKTKESSDTEESSTFSAERSGSNDRSPCELFCSTLYGPTCDGTDLIASGVAMPQCDVGDWLIYMNMGHYSISRASAFNGMPRPRLYYVQFGSDSSTN